MAKKRKISYFARRRVSCPDCGLIFSDIEVKYNQHFTCSRCKSEYSEEDFWDEQYFKYSKEMIEPE